MPDTRKKNVNWYITHDNGNVFDAPLDYRGLAVLMDIRDELQALNRLLNCGNFLGIPHTLTAIRKNTTKPKRSKRVK